MIDLRHGDCLEVMKDIPDKSVDLVIIDPPYEIHADGSRGAFGKENRQYHNEIKKLSNGVTNLVLDE